ncbi:putative nucleic acid-binding protein, contains PIN domain [Nostoc sp. PCC 7524]|uniref:nucleic acid-binding protein n=1 Tax=Nostoc sp. (strain ATCC 29411 / PCC 7524) TaxID=28072 RepID=UPI00029F18DE|nr:nucleic acid-binding protein [Nostoc sp. PCC 7524]AFY46237.1 putative nucleic acid-binding protein, contains PIN domain [Nostoc sp. PCC 7524]
MIIVSDTSPITNLAAIGQLDLLRQLYGSVIIPEAVYNEMVGVNKIVPGAVEVQTLSWIQTQTVINSLQVTEIQENNESIHLGEAEAIILSLEMKADLLLMDERRGRIVATNYGINVIGLLGVLLQAKKQGLIPVIKLYGCSFNRLIQITRVKFARNTTQHFK